MISFTNYLHIPDFVLFVKKIPFNEIGGKVQRLLSFVNLIPAEINITYTKYASFLSFDSLRCLVRRKIEAEM